MTAPDWRHRAACRADDVDPDLFHPDGYTRPYRRQIVKAKVVCWSCPVSQECLDAALDRPEKTGIWGGYTPGERNALLRNHALRRAGEAA